MKKILIIDDSITLRESLEFTLIESGYEVEKAENGKKGLQTFEEKKDFSLIFVDINMPEMNGLEFLKKLRTISDVPVIILTTVSENKKIETAKKYKANAWIIKPFIDADLINVVKKLIG